MNTAAKRRRYSAARTEATGVIVGQLRRRTTFAGEPSVADVVAAVHGIPYGRPETMAISSVLAEWMGTCSTKHLAVKHALETRFCDPAIREPFIAALARLYDRGDA